MSISTSTGTARVGMVDESVRAAAIATYDPDRLYDNASLKSITDFAAALCDCPVALVTLVEERRQTFLSRTGTDLTETPRDVSFCAHAMLDDDLMIVPDATLDPRFVDNLLVTGDPHIRFYAGAPLVGEDGVPLGALCVIDTRPHAEGLTALQRQGLATLAENVMARFSDSRNSTARRNAETDARRALNDSEGRFRTLADTMPQMVWSTQPDGFHDYYNARWYEFTGAPPGSTDGEGWNGMFHPDDQDRAWSRWRHSLSSGDPYEIEYRLRYRDGTYRWVLGRALPIRDEHGAITRWFGTCTDIHEQKLALEERDVISQELSHRIKNIFSVVSGLISFSARGRPELAELSADLRERITALGRAHDFVRPHSPASMPTAQPSSLAGLLGELFQPYQFDDKLRIRVTGDDVAIDDRSATPLALMFHELATNATKYGSLSHVDGGVAVSIVSDGSAVRLGWKEHDGPSVITPPDQNGFGTKLIEMSAMRQLGGTIERNWAPDGLEIAINVPLAAFSRR